MMLDHQQCMSLRPLRTLAPIFLGLLCLSAASAQDACKRLKHHGIPFCACSDETPMCSGPMCMAAFSNSANRYVYLYREECTDCKCVPHDIRLYVGVLSRHNESDYRQTVRQTWASHPFVYKVRFFMMRPKNTDPNYRSYLQAVRREIEEYGDLVLLQSVEEEYYQLAHVTCDIMRFGSQDSDATHILKTDVDTIIDVERLVFALYQVPRTRMLLGTLWHRNRVERQGKWAIPYDVWPEEQGKFYPTRPTGNGYVVSKDIALLLGGGLMAETMQRTGNLFPLEDTNVGIALKILVDEGVEITYVHAEGVLYELPEGVDFEKDQFLVWHSVPTFSRDDMKLIWDNILNRRSAMMVPSFRSHIGPGQTWVKGWPYAPWEKIPQSKQRP